MRDKRENAGTSGASSPTPSARFTTHDDMPSVFRRLTDPKRFNGTHKHRFAEDGVGMGLEGRREDDSHQTVIAGKAVITRDIDPVCAGGGSSRSSGGSVDEWRPFFQHATPPSRPVASS